MPLLPTEPMLAAPVDSPRLPSGWSAEPKWDSGFRALGGRNADGVPVLRSRRGTDLGPAFPEITEALTALPTQTSVDGEIVVWGQGRIAFELLQARANRRRAAAVLASQQHPAHLVAFDLLTLRGRPLLGRPYCERRAALEDLFTGQALSGTWTLCPATTDPQVAEEWLNWSVVGMEGLVFKPLTSLYTPGTRGWRKYKVRHTMEAVIGAVSGSITDPRTLLLGRYDRSGRLRYVGMTTVLSRRASREVAQHLVPAVDHQWTGWTFSAGWHTREKLGVTLVVPELVAEIRADVARGQAGRWRHPLAIARIRADLTSSEVPLFEEQDAAGQ